MANKTSYNQQHKETAGNGQRREKVEKIKYSDSKQPGENNKTYNFRSASAKAKIETKKGEGEKI